MSEKEIIEKIVNAIFTVYEKTEAKILVDWWKRNLKPSNF